MRARFEFSSTGQPVVCAHPVEMLVARRVGEVAGVMAAAERALRDGFHIAGWVAYEAAGAFDSSLTTQSPGAVPLVCFGVFREMAPAPPLT
ncbi:MAG: aminodeoxychorismate synthase, component I, partial [Acidobacteria bacterium]|nr:aminodeoxychorismate synthase, component I [Acidobacteriota bacterium]